MTQNPADGPGLPDAPASPPSAPAYGTPPAGNPPAGNPPAPNPPAPNPPAYGTPPPAQPPAHGSPPGQQYGYAPDAYGHAPAAGAPLSEQEERQWAMFAHLGGVLGILPSLIIYLVFKDRGAFVREQSKTALNFQILVLIGYMVATVLGGLLFIPGGLNGIVWILSIVFSIIAGMAANRGEHYRYPFTITVVK